VFGNFIDKMNNDENISEEIIMSPLVVSGIELVLQCTTSVDEILRNVAPRRDFVTQTDLIVKKMKKSLG